FVFSFYILFCFSLFFFSSRRRHTRFSRDWSSDVCSSDLYYAKDKESLKHYYTQHSETFRAKENRHFADHLVSFTTELEVLSEHRSEERRVGKECRSRWSA